MSILSWVGELLAYVQGNPQRLRRGFFRKGKRNSIPNLANRVLNSPTLTHHHKLLTHCFLSQQPNRVEAGQVHQTDEILYDLHF